MTIMNKQLLRAILRAQSLEDRRGGRCKQDEGTTVRSREKADDSAEARRCGVQILTFEENFLESLSIVTDANTEIEGTQAILSPPPIRQQRKQQPDACMVHLIDCVHFGASFDQCLGASSRARLCTAMESCSSILK